MTETKILGGDWGTSNFRLYLIKISDSEIIGQVSTTEGIATTFKAWTESNSPDRLEFYHTFLAKQLQKLQLQVKEHLAGIPLILSGMASSSIGMAEVPYQQLPFSLEHPKLKAKKLGPTTNFSNPITIFGGLQSKDDVMRGEEVQLLGISDLLQGDTGICLLPGTHSKHIWVKNRKVVDFQTYMTGEVFSLFTAQSILKNSVSFSNNFALEAQYYFDKGLKTIQHSSLLNAAFKVRTNTLLSQVSEVNNYYFLSGLVIGEELKALKTYKGTIWLIGDSILAKLYSRAIQMLFPKNLLQQFSKEQTKNAISKAYIKLYQEQT